MRVPSADVTNSVMLLPRGRGVLAVQASIASGPQATPTRRRPPPRLGGCARPVVLASCAARRRGGPRVGVAVSSRGRKVRVRGPDPALRPLGGEGKRAGAAAVRAECASSVGPTSGCRGGPSRHALRAAAMSVGGGSVEVTTQHVGVAASEAPRCRDSRHAGRFLHRQVSRNGRAVDNPPGPRESAGHRGIRLGMNGG